MFTLVPGEYSWKWNTERKKNSQVLFRNISRLLHYGATQYNRKVCGRKNRTVPHRGNTELAGLMADENESRGYLVPIPAGFVFREHWLYIMANVLSLLCALVVNWITWLSAWKVNFSSDIKSGTFTSHVTEMGKSIYKDLTVHSLNLAAFSLTSETVKNKNKETNKLGTAVQISRLNVTVVRHKPSDFVGMLPNPCMAFCQAFSVNSLRWRIRG